MSRGYKLIQNAIPHLRRDCIQCKKTLNVIKVRGSIIDPHIPRCQRRCACVRTCVTN
jgi:hypothetical protein